jgi:predicted nuclease with TOPRIM domain
MLGDFVGLGMANVALNERAQMLSGELQKEFAGMNERIEELMAGKETLEAAGEIMRAEEEGGKERLAGLRKLKRLEEEMDRQGEVADALLG